MTPVSVVRCADYEGRQVWQAVSAAVELLGGIGQFVPAGAKVLVKPNLLSAHPPEAAITTHPQVVESVVRLAQGAGATVTIADSPGGGTPWSDRSMKALYDVTGLTEVEDRTGAKLNRDWSARSVACPEGKVLHRVDVIQAVLDADVVITVPKLKTHAYTTLTGATKILFGIIPGLTKAGYHARLADPRRFADMLLDLLTLARPSLAIMDAVWAMHGDGPGTGGKPIHLGAVLASADSVAMDVAACRLVGLDPALVPMLVAARDRGWWDGDPGSVPLVGTPLEELRADRFELPTEGVDTWGFSDFGWFRRLVKPLIKNHFNRRPVVQPDRCTGCGTCVRSCPVEAIRLVRKRATVDDGRCIRCYCCHELCPEAAIELQYSWFGRFLVCRGAMGRQT